MRVAPRKSQFIQRMDKVAADLNVLLLVFAVGLATLDFTFMVTEKVVERLPQISRMAPDVETAAPVDSTAQAQK